MVAIAIGGALGELARYEVAQLIAVAPDGFPWATFWTNISGAFVLAVLLTFVVERVPPARLLRGFFAVGFLGAYTTFSTLAVETATLVKDGDAALGVGYAVASVSVGLMVALFGFRLGRMFRADR